jgi:hypothetical protein
MLRQLQLALDPFYQFQLEENRSWRYTGNVTMKPVIVLSTFTTILALGISLPPKSEDQAHADNRMLTLPYPVLLCNNRLIWDCR